MPQPVSHLAGALHLAGWLYTLDSAYMRVDAIRLLVVSLMSFHVNLSVYYLTRGERVSTL